MQRILIADDHEIVRRGVRLALEGWRNFEIVAEAETGPKAIEAARATKPDIAIVDYMLPELNGIEVTRAITDELPRIRVLVFSMHDRDDVVLEAHRAGASGYILKSDAENHLQSALAALSIGHRYFSPSFNEKVLERLKTSVDRGSLTPRERELVELVAKGAFNQEIGDILQISIKTVETHRATTMRKLGLKTTADLVRYALRNKIAAEA